MYQVGVSTQGVFGEQSIFEISSTQKYPLGFKRELADGRVYRYAKNSSAGALVAGKLCQAAAPVANHLDMATNTAAVGDYTVTVTDGGTAFTANAYANGFLHVNDDTGEGRSYKIKSHPANAGSATCVITLYDPIDVAFAAATTATMTKSRYQDVITCPTTLTGIAVGWAPVAVTASYYFWLQVKGECPALFHTGSGGAAAVGTAVCPATTNTPVAGAVEEADADNLLPVVGYVMRVNATTEYGLVMACIPGE